MNWTLHAYYSMSKLGVDSLAWGCNEQACGDEVAAVGEEWAAVGPGDFVLSMNGGACGEHEARHKCHYPYSHCLDNHFPDSLNWLCKSPDGEKSFKFFQITQIV